MRSYTFSIEQANTIEYFLEALDIIKKPKLIMLYCCPNIDAAYVNEKVYDFFQGVEVIGGLTGTIICGATRKNENLLVIYDEDEVEKTISVLIHLDDIAKGVFDLFKKSNSVFGKPLRYLNQEDYVGFIHICSLLEKEEHLMKTLEVKTHIDIIGGSASDNLQFEKSDIFYNGKVYSHEAILLIAKMKIKHAIAKIQSVEKTGITVKTTRVVGRTLQKLEGELAGKVYKERVSTLMDDGNIEMDQMFSKYPFGYEGHDNQIFIRTPQKITEEGYIRNSCTVEANENIHILRTTSIIDSTEDVISKLEKTIHAHNVLGCFEIMCAHRYVELLGDGIHSGNKEKQYETIFQDAFGEDVNRFGFISFGEQYIRHANQTSVVVVFYK
ncbi:MAG: hypothetical protein CVU84_05085 [Firmicutes bacterium HGW-Firmicutes-1]|jgi:hypothetical protein|nr:MAG: hypothetical protein CVU84_05085 [Firmicutes bacterium HGW-Firmicutes-1]